MSESSEWITNPVPLDGVHKVTYEWVEAGGEAKTKLTWSTLETCSTDDYEFPAPWDETAEMREKVGTAWEVEYYTGQDRDGDAHWKSLKCVYVNTTEVSDDSGATDAALLELHGADKGSQKSGKFMGKATGFVNFQGGKYR